MNCAISGAIPETPVVSVKSGHVFEKRLVLEHIKATGRCPITQEELSEDDLVAVKANKVVLPRPTTAASVHGMLTIFQNEWDSLMLETYSLKQHLDTVRQQLSTALYEHDAACRVIARLIRERDEARNALAQYKLSAVSATSASAAQSQAAEQAQAPSNAGEMETEEDSPSTVTEEVIHKIVETSQKLSKTRKNRAISESLASAETIQSYSELSSHTFHKASSPGVLSVKLSPHDANQTVSGGVDGNAIVFNRSSGKVAATLSAHTKRVNQAFFHSTQDVIFTASQDKTAKMWKPSESGYEVVKTWKHKGDVTGITLQATGAYLVSCSEDRTWGFHDINSGKTLASVPATFNGGYTCARLHPDGVILGIGSSDNVIRIWDVKAQNNVANFEGHSGLITSVAFSENGYYMASASEDRSVKIWDLRKLKNVQTITADEGQDFRTVQFDHSGLYLGIAGSDVRVYHTKSWNLVHSFTGHSAVATDLDFGPDASFLVSSSMDRSVKFWGKASA
eukprot:TRINITY_DN158_c0_g1_i1.p1 TRINITY_DN158_c0_g1~~TRINITY_DN158_c0_g1_i1.p1  ORF type:complete len:509 (+),score=130.33 TRINITY_DN158_c0_g1_i1:48-1574(+)